MAYKCAFARAGREGGRNIAARCRISFEARSKVSSVRVVAKEGREGRGGEGAPREPRREPATFSVCAVFNGDGSTRKSMFEG